MSLRTLQKSQPGNNQFSNPSGDSIFSNPFFRSVRLFFEKLPAFGYITGRWTEVNFFKSLTRTPGTHDLHKNFLPDEV